MTGVTPVPQWQCTNGSTVNTKLKSINDEVLLMLHGKVLNNAYTTKNVLLMLKFFNLFIK